MVRETQFTMHFNHFEEYFFPIFMKFANQSLIVKLSFNLKHKNNSGQVRNEGTFVLVKNKIHYIRYITVMFAVVTC